MTYYNNIAVEPGLHLSRKQRLIGIFFFASERREVWQRSHNSIAPDEAMNNF